MGALLFLFSDMKGVCVCECVHSIIILFRVNVVLKCVFDWIFRCRRRHSLILLLLLLQFRCIFSILCVFFFIHISLPFSFSLFISLFLFTLYYSVLSASIDYMCFASHYERQQHQHQHTTLQPSRVFTMLTCYCCWWRRRWWWLERRQQHSGEWRCGRGWSISSHPRVSWLCVCLCEVG